MEVWLSLALVRTNAHTTPLSQALVRLRQADKGNEAILRRANEVPNEGQLKHLDSNGEDML